MAASGLVHEDPDHIFIMMEFLFDIKKVRSYSLHDTYILLTRNPRFPRNGIWKTEIVLSKLSLNKHNQCM